MTGIRVAIPFALMASACLITTESLAETAWVTDKLRLGVHGTPDTSDKAFTFLESGDSVEILEKNRFYAHVRISDGRQGWLRVAYLVDEAPARRRIENVEKERDELAAAVDGMEAGLKERRAQLEKRERELAAEAARGASEKSELLDLREARKRLEAELSRYRASVPASWALGLVIVALLAGGGAASWWHDRRSRKRHGGYRVY